ncbi:MAG: nitroreductase family deazaflavin-dependent oxidoreductase [Actinomycetota bacterium]
MRDSIVRRLSVAHRLIYRLTGGRVGKRLVGNDMLLLTTRGRLSGRAHTVPLLYLRDGGLVVVVASYGGRPAHPDWYLNLVAAPEVTAQIRDKRHQAVARTASRAERGRWWPRLVAAYPDYARYQEKTSREIPVVLLVIRGLGTPTP